MRQMLSFYLFFLIFVMILAANCAVHVPWNIDSKPAENQQLAITITSDPEGVEIYHNEILLGTTPLDIKKLWISQHDRFSARETGYRTGIYEFYNGSQKDHWPDRQYVKLEKEKDGEEYSYKMHFKLRRGTELGQKNMQIYGSAAIILLLIIL